MSLARFLITLLLLAGLQANLAQTPQEPVSRNSEASNAQRRLQQAAGFGAGLQYIPKGLQASAGLLTRNYRQLQMGANAVVKLKASASLEDIAQSACGKSNIKDPQCVNTLMLVLMPEAYSSNNTADTPNFRALISPSQNQGECSSCVGFTVTAAAEAAVNVFMRQNHDKLKLSEQDVSFCRLVPKVDCSTGSSYESLTTSIKRGELNSWASRDCVPYEGSAGKTCLQSSTSCPSQLPKGGAFSLAYDGNALGSIARIKEQIMLNGGVMTSVAMSSSTWKRFVNYKQGTFKTSGNLTAADVVMHAVFCYGWRNDPGVVGSGWWLCKNSWSPTWGMNGNFQMAYGSGYIMQPDYTFALQYQSNSLAERVAAIKQRLQPSLSWDTKRPECLLYEPSIPERLAKLADDLTVLASADSDVKLQLADIMADVVPSNVKFVRGALSAAARGPFRLCGDTLLLLRDIVPNQPTEPPAPPPDGGGTSKICSPSRASDPACKRCAKSISAGWGHTCVILFDGSLECAGTDKAGQLGDGVPGGTSSKLVSAAAFDKAGIKVTAVATGVDFTCVLSSTNKVFCVGQGTYGQLGHGKLESSAEPVAVQGLRSARITQLVAGWNHAAVLYEDGSVQVWGSDDINRLKKASSAAAVDGVKGAASLTAGFGQTCAILRDDSVLCFAAWQDPVKVDSVGKVSRIAVRSSAAEREIGCAVVKDTARVPSHVACWGFTDVADVDSYRRIPLPGTPLDVAMGSEHTCALVEDGPTSVWCWGRNTKGQLGQGSVSDDSSLVQTPQRVSALDGLGIAALTAGVESMFARSNTGKAYAWGFNEDLGLATGRVVGAVAVPTAMIGVCQ